MARAAISKLMNGKTAPIIAIDYAINQAYHNLTEVNGYAEVILPAKASS
jgi:hypothetical protein